MATTPLWISVVGFITKAVLGLLLCLSAWSVKIMIDRRRALRDLGETKDSVLDALQSGDRGVLETRARDTDFQGRALRTLLESSQNAEAISYRLTAHLNSERNRLSRDLSVLATLGSNAPFIGLFGTVLGIIQSFAALAASDTAMNTVIASLAEALIATAVGLFVAIPALWAFNGFSQRIRRAITEAEIVRDHYLARFIYGR